MDATGERIEPKHREQASTAVYQTLLGLTSEGATVDYTAEELGGTYIFALNINGISQKSGEIRFCVSTFCTKGGQ